MITVGRAYLLLGSICTALLLLLGYECFSPIAEVETPSLRLKLPSGDVTRAPSFEMPPAASFAAIDARPIFDPSRRPVASPPDAPSANGAPLSLPSLTLVGVIIDRQTRLALIKLTEASLATAYSVGTWLGEWQIVQIEADKIILRASGMGSHELRLTAKNHTSATPAASAGDGL